MYYLNECLLLNGRENSGGGSSSKTQKCVRRHFRHSMNGIHTYGNDIEWLKQLPSDISSLKSSIHYIYWQTSYIHHSIHTNERYVSLLCVRFIANADTFGLTKWTLSSVTVCRKNSNSNSNNCRTNSWLFEIIARQALQWKVTFGIKINWKIVKRHANSFTSQQQQPRIQAKPSIQQNVFNSGTFISMSCHPTVLSWFAHNS